MPAIPNANLALTTLDGPEVSAAIYGPGGTTLEKLNGGLDSVNYAGGAGSIPAYAIQPGCFAVGRTFATDDWEMVYAMQLSSQGSGAEEPNRVQLAHVGMRYFLPYNVGFLLLHWEGYFRHDAYLWDDGVTNAEEYWDLRCTLDGSRIPAVLQTLPYGRRVVGLPAAAAPDQMPATRWRYVSKSLALFSGAGLQKGWHTLQLTIWAKPVSGSDALAKLKCVLPTASCTVIGIR